MLWGKEGHCSFRQYIAATERKLFRAILFRMRQSSHGLFTLAATIGAIHYIKDKVISPGRTCGPSMKPTLDDIDFVWVKHCIDFEKDLHVGDVVVAFRPTDCQLHAPRVSILKRIKGMPGDVIKVCFKSSLKKGMEGAEVIIRVPPGHIWVEGDNTAQSSDSRDWGPLPLSLVGGKVLAKFNPFDKHALDLPEDLRKKWERQAQEIRAKAGKQGN